MDIEDDIAEMRAEEQAQRAEAKITMFELISSPTLRLPLIIAIVMQLSQQLSGINAVSHADHTDLRRFRQTKQDDIKSSPLYFRIFLVTKDQTYFFSFPRLLGLLLLYQFVHDDGVDRDSREVRDDRDRRRHGRHDADLHPADGQERASNPSPLRIGWNVCLLHLYHHLIPRQGAPRYRSYSQIYQTSFLLVFAVKIVSLQFLWMNIELLKSLIPNAPRIK